MEQTLTRLTDWATRHSTWPPALTMSLLSLSFSGDYLSNIGEAVHLFCFRAGTALTTLDNNGRTPLQLAQSKLKLLQRNQSDSDGMSRVRKLFAEKIT